MNGYTRSEDEPVEPRELRRIDGIEALIPDRPTFPRTWAARTNDHYYRCDVGIVQIGMSEPQAFMRFEFVGDGPLDPNNARAGMNMRVGRAGLRVVSLILQPVDRVAYDALGPPRED